MRVKIRQNGDAISNKFRVGAYCNTPLLRDQKGAVLITVITVLVFLATLGLSLMAFLLSQSAYAQMQVDRLKAFYLAEAALAKSLHELKTGIDKDGEGAGNIPAAQLGAGTCWAKHDFSTSTITASGKVNKVTRKVQIKYSAI